MKTVADINFDGKRALIRVDFNVPLNDQFEVTDDTRIRRSLPTITKILADGGSVVLMSHLGRPKDGPEDAFSLWHVVAKLEALTKTDILFAEDCISEEAFAASKELQAGQILLLNNLRFYKEETKGDPTFAEKLSKHGDIYVNDAFGTAHRAHASTAVIAQFFSAEHKCAGLLMAGEVKNARKVLNEAVHPLTAIIGGAKVSSKIDIIDNLIPIADNIIIGGGMAYTFFKAMGQEVGSSLVEDDKLDTAKEVLRVAKEQNTNILLPGDSICADNFSNDANFKNFESGTIPEGWMGLDIGINAIDEFTKAITSSKTILWNGPMGVFEFENSSAGTKAIATAVATATKDGAFSLVGGGDSVAAVNQFGFADQVSYVSTGGGAMLEFFEGKELPGVAALEG